MLERLFALQAYLKYWLLQEDQFSIQGPFLTSIYQGLHDFVKTNKTNDLDCEVWRKSLLTSPDVIPVLDLGAGSKKVNQESRKVSSITKYSTSGRKFCQLYQYFATLTPAKTLVELGTCTGISTRYLASVTKGELFTFEGASEIQKVAKKNTSNLPINFILGDIQRTLPNFLLQEKTIDFALIDANHTYDGTISSFTQILPHLEKTSVVAIGDIHWSNEMQRAWEEIKSHSSVRVSLDFYEAGILLFDSPLDQKENLILSY